jgi:hypothetical protein
MLAGETFCPMWTGCPAEIPPIQNKIKQADRSFRHHNSDPTLSPQHIDADILRVTFKREVNGSLSDPEIAYLNVLKKWRQDRLRK